MIAAFGLCSIFAASAAEIIYVNPSGTVPAAGSEVASSIGVSEISITIPGGGEIGIESINRRGKLVSIERDGQPYAVLNSMDEAKITFSSKSVNDIVLHPGLINEPGTYTVSIPENLVQMAVDSGVLNEGEDEGAEPNTYLNAAYKFSFTIVAMPEFAVSPLPGLYQPSDIETFTVSFPAGSQVALGSSASSIALYNYDYFTSSINRVTEYSAKADGNKLILTAKSPAAIKALTGSISREWDYLLLPKNAVTITLDGQTYQNPALKFEKYDVRVVGAEGFTISPSPSEGLLPMDVREFTISYPSKYALDSTVEVGTIIAFLKQTGSTEDSRLAYSGSIYGNFKVKEIDESAHTITMRMADPVFEFAYENNPDLMETSYYCVSFSPRVFKGLAVLNFPGYHVTGKDGCSLSGVSVIVNGTAQNELELEKGESFTGFDIFYPFDMKKSGTTGTITLTLNGNKVGSISSSNIYLPAKGDKYMALNFGKAFKTAGEYELTIPAGIFTQTMYGDYTNLEQKIKVTIGGGTSGVDDIATEDDDTEAIYYTLDGRKVNAAAPAPGLYIVRKGKKVSKVFVK